jgi:hypothetical protein
MKYSQMLCLVRPKEKAELEKTIAGTFPLVFAKNQKDFRARLTEDSYLVVSLLKTALEYSRTEKLMRAFPNSAFVFFQLGANDDMPYEAGAIMEEPNAVRGQYGPRELRDNYLGTIEDVWDMRCRKSLPYCEEIHRATEERQRRHCGPPRIVACLLPPGYAGNGKDSRQALGDSGKL